MGTVKGYRGDGTLSVEFVTLPDGTKVTSIYGKDGTHIVETHKVLPQISDETKELIKSVKLLSKKRKKYHITSTWKEKGE